MPDPLGPMISQFSFFPRRQEMFLSTRAPPKETLTRSNDMKHASPLDRATGKSANKELHAEQEYDNQRHTSHEEGRHDQTPPLHIFPVEIDEPDPKRKQFLVTQHDQRQQVLVPTSNEYENRKRSDDRCTHGNNNMAYLLKVGGAIPSRRLRRGSLGISSIKFRSTNILKTCPPDI